MSLTRVGRVVAIGLGTLTFGVLTGCTVVPEPAPSQVPVAIPATQTCEEVSDVGTLVSNLGFAKNEGRVNEQEWVGVKQLAARMLARIDAEPATPVGDALAELQGLISTPVGALATIDVESAEWFEALPEFSDACIDAGYEFGVYGWVGG